MLAANGDQALAAFAQARPVCALLDMRDLIDDLPSVELLTAPDAETGLELIRNRRPAVVILDINLPGMSGFEAARQLREWPETREIPVIGLSAAALVRDPARAHDAGSIATSPSR